MKKNLVIVRAGIKSLHATWLGTYDARRWDLFISPFQKVIFEAEPGVVVGDVIQGQKWTGLAELLNNWPSATKHWREYEYVWLPDDDLFTSQDALNSFFEMARRLNARLCSPALHECSYYSWLVTMRNKSFVARRTNFVEIMMPCFLSSVLEEVLPTLSLSKTGFGWGLDYLWPHLLNQSDIYILDRVAVLHTRPAHSALSEELIDRNNNEMRGILSAHNITTVSRRTVGGLDQKLNFTSEGAADFMARLIRGWSYLIDTTPTLITHILEEQGYRR